MGIVAIMERQSCLMTFSRNMVQLSTVIALCLTVTEVLSVQLCGRQLADMLDEVCYGRGFHWEPRTANVPEISRRVAVQYLESTSSHTSTGIVTECCRKACSVHEVESYCATGTGHNMVNTLSELSSEINARVQTDTQETTTQTTRSPTLRPTTRQIRPRIGLFRLFRRQTFFVVQKLGPGVTRSPIAL